MLSVFLFLLLIYGVSDKETEESKPEPMTVMEGDSVTLHTDLTEVMNDDTILWLFGPKDLLISQMRRKDDFTPVFFTDDPGFRGRLQVDQKTGSLTIRNTRTRHTGQYKLTISREITTTKTFNVTVIDEEKKSVMEGDSLTLLAGLTNIQGIDTIEWCYEAEENRIAEIIEGKINILSTSADGRFRSKLRLDKDTGDLTINNIRTIHSGLYILKISSSSKSVTKSTTRTKRKRFIVTVGVRTLTVNAGDCVTLETHAEMQSGDLMLWTFGPENRLVVKTDSGGTSISESFRDRLEPDNETGSLTIRNIGITDSGHFKLQIINSERTTFRRFNVTLIGSTEEQVNEDTQLINVDVPVGVNEQQATSSI